MRVATYGIPAEEGDGEDAECAVFYFGPGQGGTVRANLQRWYGQFEQPDGRPSSEAAQLQETTVDGIKITVVDVSGTYLSSAAPMSPEKVKKPEFSDARRDHRRTPGAGLFQADGSGENGRTRRRGIRSSGKKREKGVMKARFSEGWRVREGLCSFQNDG